MDTPLDGADLFGFDNAYDMSQQLPQHAHHHHQYAFDNTYDMSQQLPHAHMSQQLPHHQHPHQHSHHDPLHQHAQHQQRASQHQQQQHEQLQRHQPNTMVAATTASTSAAVAALHNDLSFNTALGLNPMMNDWMFGAAFAPVDSTFATYANQLQTSPINFNINTPHGLSQMAAITAQPPLQMSDIQHEFSAFPASVPDYTAALSASASSSTGSPTEQLLEVGSMASDNSWILIDSHRNSRDFTDVPVFVNPSQTLHIRTSSASSQQSDVPASAHSFSSYEDIQFPMHSPQSEADTHPLALISPGQSVSPPMAYAMPAEECKPSVSHTTSPTSSGHTTSPTSSGAGSPPTRRRKSPVAPKLTTSKVTKKAPAHSTKKDHIGEKRVGRRKGPLRPDQRLQAHEIRKLRACLRCKFLKKTCDKGDPCAGCQPSHARLWQVPCTRIDIKDIAYFMKDWKADYERHVSLGFSVGNIKGFSTYEREIYITHGYGHYLPIMAREVYVRDDKCFGVDWIETLHGIQFEMNTARLSAGMEGIPHALLSHYLDQHVDQGFEQFIDEYFEGTPFVTELLKTAYRFYCREKQMVIRKALKLVIAYNLTLHVTMVEGLGEDNLGKVEDEKSKFCGKTVAPVMINFQVKCALADMWRELQKDVLEELSALYSSVYSGDKLKNWPTIFMLAAILLAVWELIQFDCAYRVPDQAAVDKFVNDMESTPVGVIVGLFSAISQKLPSFQEWDTRKHHHLLQSNPAVCEAMTEVRAHVTRHDAYLRTRSDCKFDRSDFDSLSNKFLSKLVIRAN
ncbi:hypothetical protein M011DRAFT_496618 [Sporormia fimetaria CBS 119925]|uniref:Zn(2)-C6 fungal-type domain-containing protein n=1 Tax=Sporormia fimetaria CBS 119925 TaxID=1340428 RepID=A0A6A6V1Z2_9PLEO|nr:hypothetical protein M011DRAFT_496618 [Sporormia fimetaria CBS 119925]